MFAMWQVNTYTVNININSSTNDTTVADYFWNGDATKIAKDEGLISISLYVVFDTNNWYYETTTS